MINCYIFNRKLFILRSLVITFYKIKSLSDAFINKFGVFTKSKFVNKSDEGLVKFARKVFFNIQD